MRIAWQRLANQHPAVGFVDAILRGAGQLMFQDNPFTGLLFLVGLFYGSCWLGIAGLIGLTTSTLAAVWLGADRAQVGAGVFGFNGLLVGVALAFLFRFDAWLLAGIVLGSTLAAVLMLALCGCFRAWDVPALTAPFVVTLWLLLLAAHQLPLLLPAVPQVASEVGGTGLSLASLITASLRGVGQVLFQDSAVAGMMFLLAIGTLAAVALGGQADLVHHGVYGFNATLCAIAIGGLLFVLTWQAAFFALAGAVASTWLMGSLATLLAPLGLPALSAPFALIIWLGLLLRPVIRVLRWVPLTEITTPEQIRQAFLARQKNP
jgi:urea transporter